MEENTEQTTPETTPEAVTIPVTDTTETSEVTTEPAVTSSPITFSAPVLDGVTDATSNTTGEPAVVQPNVPTVPEAAVVSQDGPTARSNLLAAGEQIEGVLTHLNNNRTIHHDVTELENKLKEARQWIATELDVPLTIFGNPAAN